MSVHQRSTLWEKSRLAALFSDIACASGGKKRGFRRLLQRGAVAGSQGRKAIGRGGFLIAAAVSVFAVGCASTPPATAEISRARTLIEQAEKAGAQRYAAVELDQARNKLRLAEVANKDGKRDEARDRANEAAADAELAQARTSSGEAQKAAEEVQKSTETLRQETERRQEQATTTSPSPN